MTSQRKGAAAGTAEQSPGDSEHAEPAQNVDPRSVRQAGKAPASRPRLFGTPVRRILSRAGGETVGFLYEWDNGDCQPLWTAEPVSAVTYAPLSPAASTNGDETSQS